MDVIDLSSFDCIILLDVHCGLDQKSFKAKGKFYLTSMAFVPSTKNYAL